MLDALAPDLWTMTVPNSLGGLQLGMRVTIVRLPDGGLWVHSPIRLDEALRVEVAALGAVRHVIAPNLLHHCHVADWLDAWEGARLHGPEGLGAKRADLIVDRAHRAEPDPEWGGVLEPLPMSGMPKVDETCFLHRPSGTLISADLAFAIPPDVPSWWTRTYLKMSGIHGKPAGCTVVHKLGTRDKAAARRSLNAMLERDWSRLVVSHGAVLDTGDVRAHLEAAWGWLPR